MKKKLLVIPVLFICLCVLTGCGSSGKKISCTMVDEETGMSSDLTIHYDKDGNAKNAEVELSMEGGSAEVAQLLKSSLDVTYQSTEGVEYSSKVNGTKVVLNLKVDYSKVSDEELEQNNLVKVSYDKAKETYEAAGWTCK